MSEPDIPSLNELDTTKVFFTDLNGRLMSLSVNPHYLNQIYENGTGIDGSSIAGMTTVDNSDNLLFPVRESFCDVKPENKHIDFLQFDMSTQRASCDPKSVLQRVLKEAATKCTPTI